MDKTLGFIGAGNMVGAILAGVLKEGLTTPDGVWLSNRSPEKLEPWAKSGVHVTLDNVAVAENADIIVLGVKPQVMGDVLPQVAPHAAGKCVVSIAAGISSAYLKKHLPGAMVVRAIPNTPMKLGLGATVVAAAPDVPEDLFRTACSLFEAAGTIAVIPEAQLDDFIIVSGSSPALFFRIAAAMANEAREVGIDHDLALRMAAQTMLGAASMLLHSGSSPEELIRQVCSPGGTTLAALTALDEYRFEEMYHEAAVRCARRSKELGK